MIPVDGQVMLEIAPRFSGAQATAQAAIIREVGPVLAPTLEDYGITTRLRIAHFLGQTCHESAGFRTTIEFADGTAYEGRADLGNTQAGDGPRYKGRGLIQLTGRANYRTCGAALGIDLEAHPERAAEPPLSLRIACEYWKQRAINPMCDRDDLLAVTRAINGGLNGLDDRRGRTQRAKDSVARIEGIALSGATPSRPPDAPRALPILRRGSNGAAVAELQTVLRTLGFPIAVDGDFGGATELAVLLVQIDQRIGVDGLVGPETRKALAAAPRKPLPA